MYILDLSMTLTFDLYVGGGGILSEFYSQFLSCLNLLMSLQLYSDCDLDSVVFGHYSLRITWYYIIFHMMCTSLQRMLIPRVTGTGQPPTRPPPLLLMDHSRIGSTTPPCPSPPTSGMRTPSQGNQSQPILRAKNNHHTEVFKSLCEVI